MTLPHERLDASIVSRLVMMEVDSYKRTSSFSLLIFLAHSCVPLALPASAMRWCRMKVPPDVSPLVLEFPAFRTTRQENLYSLQITQSQDSVIATQNGLWDLPFHFLLWWPHSIHFASYWYLNFGFVDVVIICLSCFILFYSSGDWIQGLVLANTLPFEPHFSSLYLLVCFSEKISHFCPDQPQTTILLLPPPK
jgi:hypothetical protein